MEIKKEFHVLKTGGTLVSLRGMPNAEFSRRTGMPMPKQILFGVAGHKYDKMAAGNHQKYYVVFVREDGPGLQKISETLQNGKIEPSVDSVYELSEVNQALLKVAQGGSKGKTVIKMQ